MGWLCAQFCGGKSVQRETENGMPAHPSLERCMTLQEILFGSFTPPDAPSRTHRIGFASAHRYVPPKPKVSNLQPRDKTNPGQARVLKAVRAAGVPVTSVDVSLKTKMTRNHCGILLGQLYNKGLLKRARFSKGSTRFYKYTIADKG